MTMPKEEAKKILDNMPEQVTWDDIMYQFYVKRKISMSLKDVLTMKREKFLTGYIFCYII